MGPGPPQTRKGTQGFPFQTLPHSAGNGREKSGAGAPKKAYKIRFYWYPDMNRNRMGEKKRVQNLLFSGMMVGRKVRDAA